MRTEVKTKNLLHQHLFHCQSIISVAAMVANLIEHTNTLINTLQLLTHYVISYTDNQENCHAVIMHKQLFQHHFITAIISHIALA